MGIAFIAEKAKKFRHKRDAAFDDEFGSANLMSPLPESISYTFRCKSTHNAPLAVGIRVMLLRAKDDIQVIYLNHRVGTVMQPDAGELDALMLTKKSPMRSARVVEVHQLSQTFVVQLTSRKKAE